MHDSGDIFAGVDPVRALVGVALVILFVYFTWFYDGGEDEE